jgi:hypothetical protein
MTQYGQYVKFHKSFRRNPSPSRLFKIGHINFDIFQTILIVSLFWQKIIEICQSFHKILKIKDENFNEV